MPVTATVDAEGVARVTLDRPAKRNALDRAMLLSLGERVAELREQAGVRVLVLRGAGGTFCAGADIADWVDPPHQVAVENSRLGQTVFGAIADFPAPTLAVIDGVAVGGGLELALACDLRIAGSGARLGLPELGLGNLPSWGGTARMAGIAGLGVTRQLLLSGELVSGARAAELLLVSSAHPEAELEEAVAAAVARLLAAEPTAVALAKGALAALERTIASESALAGYTAGLDTSRERKQRFLDRKAAARAAQRAAPADSAQPTVTATEGSSS